MDKVVFFDWDGTLCSKEVSQEANVKRTQFFNPKMSRDEIVQGQHNNNNEHYLSVREQIKNNVGDIGEDYVRTFQATIFGYYYVKTIHESDQDYFLFNRDMLEELKKRFNVEYVIVTSLYEGSINGALKNMDLDSMFDGVYACPTDLSTDKMDNLARAVKDYTEIGYKPVAMLGDRGEDIDAGNYHGLDTIFCNYGHGDVENANYIAHNTEDTLKYLKEILTLHSN